MLEYECTLKCNYRCDYCTNGRNECLKTPFQEASETDVVKFLTKISQTYSDELFIFGGEPFLAKNIRIILKTLNELKYPYVVQTNFSCYNIIDECFKNLSTVPRCLQISIHSEFIKDWNKLITYIKKYQSYIRNIDVMYSSKNTLKDYRLLYKHFKDLVHIAPVADFKTSRKKYRYVLYEFNKFKRILSNFNFESGERSFKWEEQMKGLWTPKGKPCMYKDRYILFAPDLSKYTCSHRLNADVCPNDSCFLM